MRTKGKLIIASLLIALAAFLRAAPVSAQQDTLDQHPAHHYVNVHTPAQLKTDCVSNCSQNMQAEKLAFETKTVKRKKNNQPRPDFYSVSASQAQYLKQTLQTSKDLPAKQIFKFTCAYLF